LSDGCEDDRIRRVASKKMKRDIPGDI